MKLLVYRTLLSQINFGRQTSADGYLAGNPEILAMISADERVGTKISTSDPTHSSQLLSKVLD